MTSVENAESTFCKEVKVGERLIPSSSSSSSSSSYSSPTRKAKTDALAGISLIQQEQERHMSYEQQAKAKVKAKIKSTKEPKNRSNGCSSRKGNEIVLEQTCVEQVEIANPFRPCNANKDALVGMHLIRQEEQHKAEESDSTKEENKGTTTTAKGTMLPPKKRPYVATTNLDDDNDDGDHVLSDPLSSSVKEVNDNSNNNSSGHTIREKTSFGKRKRIKNGTCSQRDTPNEVSSNGRKTNKRERPLLKDDEDDTMEQNEPLLLPASTLVTAQSTTASPMHVVSAVAPTDKKPYTKSSKRPAEPSSRPSRKAKTNAHVKMALVRDFESGAEDLGPREPEPFKVIDDPNPYYIEEEAHLYHNPPLPSKMTVGVLPKDLKKIPPAPPLPAFPNTGKCDWKFDEEQRILLADFTCNESQPFVMDPEDERFFVAMLERNDITVISEGFVSQDKLDPSLWSLQYLARVLGSEYFHKFRRFDTVRYEDGSEKCIEVDGLLSMKMSDYVEYMKRRRRFLYENPATAAKDEVDATAYPSKGNVANQGITTAADSDGYAHDKASAEDIRNRCMDLFPATVLSNDEKHKLRKESTAATATEVNEGPPRLVPTEEDNGKEKVNPLMMIVDHEGHERKIHVGKSAIYLIDFDVQKLAPLLYKNFLDTFKYPEVLPGGDHCMMNSVTPNGRPFMGPNMYITPPASFTHFHQDGHGTVDSGHLCIRGYNEVVLLRRLTERHKKHALWILTGNRDSDKEEARPAYFDGLYQEPHSDELGEKPGWPTKDLIQECKEMGYCPTVCVVKPGQLIHINKGRLHAFRKMSNGKLPENDCHYEMREQIKREENLQREEICISLAWDWMFRGVTAEGINREICSVLECTILNRKHGKVSLAIPELSLLQMARVFPSCGARVPADVDTMLGCRMMKKSSVCRAIKCPLTEARDVLRGMLPGLEYVVGHHLTVMGSAENRSRLTGRGERVTVAKRPNAHENPNLFPVDPYGSHDFNCKLCSKELANVYFHCDGCEVILSKDFNICQECHAEKKFMHMIQMHPLNKRRHSTINHTGNMNYDRRSRCPCRKGPVCNHCGYCAGCSCRCHTWFTLHNRFFDKDAEEALLERVQKQVEVDRKVEDARRYAKERFEMAAKNYDLIVHKK